MTTICVLPTWKIDPFVDENVEEQKNVMTKVCKCGERFQQVFFSELIADEVK